MRSLIAILILIILCIGLSYWNDSIQWKQERGTFILNDSLLQKKVLDIRDSNNRSIIAYEVQAINTNQLLTSQSEHIQQLEKDLKLAEGKLKNVKSSTSISSTTHDSVYIPVEKTVYLKDTGWKLVPFSYKPDSFLSVTGTTNIHIGQDTLRIEGHDLLYGIMNRSTVTFYNETRFLHRQKLKALITQDNPHTITNRVQTYYINPEKKWFEKWYAQIAAGVIGGILLANSLR